MIQRDQKDRTLCSLITKQNKSMSPFTKIKRFCWGNEKLRTKSED